MDVYPLGQPIGVPIETFNTADPPAPVDVDPLPTLTLVRPDRTVSLPITAEDLPGTGQYQVVLQPSDMLTVGRYRLIPEAVGANAGLDFEVFDVFDPLTYPRLVSFDDAAKAVNLQGTEDDAFLDRVIGWASARVQIEYQGGLRLHTQRVNVRGGDPFFTLSRVPVRSIITVTSAAGFYSPAADEVVCTHPHGGLVTFSAGLLHGPYDVTYEVGSPEVPPGLDGAAIALIQHWWQQVTTRRTMGYASNQRGTVPDFRGLPNTVRNMLDVVPRAWGMA